MMYHIRANGKKPWGFAVCDELSNRLKTYAAAQKSAAEVEKALRSFHGTKLEAAKLLYSDCAPEYINAGVQLKIPHKLYSHSWSLNFQRSYGEESWPCC